MNLKNSFLVLLGAVTGGLVGCVVFFWLAHHGFYGLVLPGGLLGLGAGIFKTNSKVIAGLCGLLALALGFLTEWRFAPFVTDSSFGYFVSHVHQLKPITLIMIAAGTWIGFWIPFRRSQEVTKVKSHQI